MGYAIKATVVLITSSDLELTRLQMKSAQNAVKRALVEARVIFVSVPLLNASI